MVKFIGFIPARKGSRRVPNKNLKLVNKKPLIYYSIFSSKKSKHIGETVVFSDSKKINYVAKKLGASTNYKRPKNISTSKTSMFETMSYFIKKNKIQKKFDYIVLLQPTSPLRNVNDLNRACKIILNNKKVDGLISTFYVKNKKKEYPNKYMYLKNKLLIQIDKDEIGFKKKIFLRNGPSIFILKIKSVKKNLYKNKLLNFIMPEKRSLDLNTLSDFKKLKSLI